MKQDIISDNGNLNKPCGKIAFTLAEVLITLSVIGIVAAMTMPVLINKFQERVTVTKLKKFYNVLSQGYLYAVEEYGTPDTWGITERDAGSSDEEEETYYAENAILIRNRLLKNVKIQKECDNAKNQVECGLATYSYFKDGSVDSEVSGSSSKTAGALLIDGSSVSVIANNNSRGSGVLSSVYALIYIDVNGIKSPNTYGQDKFFFYLTNNNIVPCGTSQETSYTFEKSCYTRGLGCEAWIIQYENMDYLHCTDLSWGVKTKCN